MGRCPDRLRDLVGGGRRAVVIANAADVAPSSDRAAGVRRELDALEELGFDAVELDLRDHFDGRPIVDEVHRHDLVWVRGVTSSPFVTRSARAGQTLH
jgi:dipeptidase E